MLKTIRENAQGLVVWIIGIIIIIPFALWGIQDYLGGGGGTDVVVTIDGEDVKEQEFQRYYKIFRQTELRKLEQLGKNLPPSILEKLTDDKMMRKAAAEAMVRQRLLLKTALVSGFEIGDQQLSEVVRVMPAFQKDGVFDKTLYEYAVRNQGMTTVGFENSLRNDLIAQQLISGILLSEFATETELEGTTRLVSQKRNAGYMVIPSSRYASETSPTEEQLKSFFDEHAAEYVTEEQARIRYIELSEADVARNVTVSDEVLRKYYDDHTSDYAVPDTTEADAKISQIRQGLEQGTPFEELAAQHSEDEGSRESGGDLGYFGRGVMAPPFEDKVFSMEKGEISEPVETSFGLHIIKLTDIRDEERQASHILVRVDKSKTRIRPFEEVVDDVRKQATAQIVEEHFIEQTEMLTNLTYEVANTLEDAANALELEIKTAGPFTRDGGEGLAKYKKVVNTAFSEDVLAGNNSEPIEIDRNHFVVLRIDEHIPARHQTLDEVRDDIRARVIAMLSAEKAATTGEIIVDRLGKGDSVDDVSKEHSLDWHAPAMLERKTDAVDSGILNAAFSMARPADDKPRFSGVSLNSGDYAIIGLYAVEDGDMQGLDKKHKEILLRKAIRAYGESIAQHFLQRTRDLASVTIHEPSSDAQ